MTITKKLAKIIESTEKKCSTGAGELSQGLFDEASALLSKEECLSEANKALELDTFAFFTNTTIACGVLRGLKARIQASNTNKKGTTHDMPQANAFAIVDIWGRIVGVEAVIFEIAHTFEHARREGFSVEAIKSKMGVVYHLLETTLCLEIGELAKLGILSVIGDSADRLMALIRSEKQGVLGKALDAHINSLLA